MKEQHVRCFCEEGIIACLGYFQSTYKDMSEHTLSECVSVLLNYYSLEFSCGKSIIPIVNLRIGQYAAGMASFQYGPVIIMRGNGRMLTRLCERVRKLSPIKTPGLSNFVTFNFYLIYIFCISFRVHNLP